MKHLGKTQRGEYMIKLACLGMSSNKQELDLDLVAQAQVLADFQVSKGSMINLKEDLRAQKNPSVIYSKSSRSSLEVVAQEEAVLEELNNKLKVLIFR
jgi:hypothetical protein